MRKSIIALVLGALLSHHVTTYAQTSTAQEFKFKRQIVEYGTDQKVKIKLQSGETLKGHIAEIKNDSFTLQFIDATGHTTNREIAYSELSKVSKTGDANNTFKRSVLMGAGFYLGMMAVGLVAFGIAAAASR